MHTVKRSKAGTLWRRRAARRWLLGLCGLTIIAWASSPARAQDIFEEHYDTIYVPGKPGEVPSAPTIQAAIDMATGRTFIAVSLTESPGFAAEGKEIAISLGGTTITSTMTFIGCPRAILEGKFTTGSLIAFVKCQNVLLQGGTTDTVLIEDSSYGIVNNNTINGGLMIRRSAGLAIGPDLFTQTAPALVVSDCNDPPPASPPPTNWARNVSPYNPHTIEIGSCRFETIGPNATTAAALFINSRLHMQRCDFNDIGVRGIEAHDCADVSLQFNTLNKVTEAGILFFNSEGVAESNKMGAFMQGLTTGIYIATDQEKPPRRSRVTVKGNEIYDADRGIFAYNSTVEITGNSINRGLFGIIAEQGTDGAIVGAQFFGTRFFGMALYQVAPGFIVENTTMDQVQGYGLLVLDSKQVTVKNVEWRDYCSQDCDRAENIHWPLITGGMQIVSSEVKLDYVRVGSRLTGAALLVEGGSTVQASATFNAFGDGVGIIVDGSTVTGSLSTWDDGRGLVAQYGAKVSLSGGELISNINGDHWGSSAITPLTVEGGSEFEMTQGQVTQKSPLGVTAAQIAAAPDTVRVSGDSKIHLSGTGIFGLGTVIHLSSGSQGVFDACQVDGSATDLGNGNISEQHNTGPLDGYLVEDSGSTAEIRGGLIRHNGRTGIRARNGGSVMASDVTTNFPTHGIWAGAGGKVEMEGGKIDQVSIGVQVDRGGEATVRNATVQYFNETGVRVAAGGKCEVTNCTIQNGKLGIQADAGSSVTQSGNRFNTLESEVTGTVAAGGAQ